MIFGAKNGTTLCYFDCFSFAGVLVFHFVGLHPYIRAAVLAMPIKSYLKWRVIQLAIHSTVGPLIDYE